MLRTLRIWKWTRMSGMGEWPWRTPWDILSSWKFSYNYWGRREFLKLRLEKFLSFVEWYIPTKRTRRFRREVRRTYLESRIYVLKCLAKDAEERAEELENANLHK